MSDTETREKIICEAEDVFAKYGYRRANLEDIASRLGKGKSFIYYYFRNKEEIFSAVLRKEADRLISELSGTADSSKDTRKKLRDFIIIKAKILREVVNYSRMIKEEYLKEKVLFENLRSDLEKKEFEIVCTIFNSGIESGELRKLDPGWTAESFLTAMKGFEFPLMTKDSFENVEKRADKLLDLIFYGIASEDARKKIINN